MFDIWNKDDPTIQPDESPEITGLLGRIMRGAEIAQANQAGQASGLPWGLDSVADKGREVLAETSLPGFFQRAVDAIPAEIRAGTGLTTDAEKTRNAVFSVLGFAAVLIGGYIVYKKVK